MEGNNRLKNWLIAAVVALVVSLGTCAYLGYSFYTTSEALDVAESSIHTLKVDVAELENSVAAKDEKIAELENSTATKDEKIAELENSTATKDEKIAELETQLATKTTSYSGGGGSSSSGDTNSRTVYITRTGSKYHEGWCHHLHSSKIAVSLSNAKARGYGACSVCH